jgi:hypothetical protein
MRRHSYADAPPQVRRCAAAGTPMRRRRYADAPPQVRRCAAAGTPMRRHSYADAPPQVRRCAATATPMRRHSYADARQRCPRVAPSLTTHAKRIPWWPRTVIRRARAHSRRNFAKCRNQALWGFGKSETHDSPWRAMTPGKVRMEGHGFVCRPFPQARAVSNWGARAIDQR